MTEFQSSTDSKSLNLRVIGFCGADDSVDPALLQLVSTKYSWVEWGILFRPDLENSPRYPSWSWVQRLAQVNKENGGIMRLAGHLCGSRCQEVLGGDYSFVAELHKLGFSRVQVNATTANAVDMDTARLPEYAHGLRTAIENVPEVEWIFQLNDETRQLWGLLTADGDVPSNVSVLFDASCGKGIFPTSLQPPLTNPDVLCGYAGGIGPNTIANVLEMVIDSCEGKPVWIDMESSLRVAISDKQVLDKDVFSVDKCFACIQVAVSYGMPVSRFTALEV
mmetsp:Transcript_3122/g.4822  ORF Transcript_3122/g.4822 Transcript_3122/m.4822 type:complete len:278 (+) Transcript_3122:64-897(+)